MISSERASHSSTRPAPGGDAVAAEDNPDGRGCSRLIAAMSRPSWKPGAAPRYPGDPIAEASSVSASPSAAVASAMPASGCRWSTWARLDQAMHGGVDRRGRAALAEGAEVERRDHLVFARRRQGRRSPERAARPAGARPGRPRSSVPRSPPDPFTHISSAGCPVTGSVAVPLPKCCRRRSSCCVGRPPAG